MSQRVAWHRAHQQHCACRPIPAKLRELMERELPRPKLPKKSSTKPVEAAPLDPRFGKIIESLGSEAGVTHGGKGFGASGLKANGKLFAMMSSRGKFVAKLPRARVDELVARGQGAYFDPGHGRLMKEWVELEANP